MYPNGDPVPARAEPRLEGRDEAELDVAPVAQVEHLDELRRARARALVRREVGRTTMQYSIDDMKSSVANNGVRALMFRPGTVSSLKTVDYVLLGFKLSRWLLGLRNNRRRRR